MLLSRFGDLLLLSLAALSGKLFVNRRRKDGSPVSPYTAAVIGAQFFASYRHY